MFTRRPMGRRASQLREEGADDFDAGKKADGEQQSQRAPGGAAMRALRRSLAIGRRPLRMVARRFSSRRQECFSRAPGRGLGAGEQVLAAATRASPEGLNDGTHPGSPRTTRMCSF